MKTHQVLLVVITMCTAHAFPKISQTKEAPNLKIVSANKSPNFYTLSSSSITKIRESFLDELQKVMDDWKKSIEKFDDTDPSSEIEKLDTTGKSHMINEATMKLTDSQISEIQTNFNNSLNDDQIRNYFNESNFEKQRSGKESKEATPIHTNISGRSKNHNEPISTIYVWNSNALTKEQWQKIRKNVEENKDILKYDLEDDKRDFEKYSNNELKIVDGRSKKRDVNTEYSEEPKYYSFSNAEWEELKQTLHKHLNGDDKIQKINESSHDTRHHGRSRNEKHESTFKGWGHWNTYTLKPSDWNQLRKNIRDNEFIMNKTVDNIAVFSKGRSIEIDSKSNGYDNKSSKDNTNVIIVKPVTGERMYSLKKNFEWDRLLEDISSINKNSNATNEDKDDSTKVDYNEDFTTQGYNQKEKNINESSQMTGLSQSGRTRHRNINTRGKIVVSPSQILNEDDENLNIEAENNITVDSTVVEFFTEFETMAPKYNIITTTEEYIAESASAENSTAQFNTKYSQDHLRNSNTTYTQGLTNSPSNIFGELNENTVTISANYLLTDISNSPAADYSTENVMLPFNDLVYENTAQLQPKLNTSHERFITNISVENDQVENDQLANDYSISTITLQDNTMASKEYDTATESIQFENITIESYISNIKTEDPIVIMNDTTNTQNIDADINDDTEKEHTLTTNTLFRDDMQNTRMYDSTTVEVEVTTNTLNKHESEYTAIYNDTTADNYIMTSKKYLSTADPMDSFENTNTIYYGLSTFDDYGITDLTNNTTTHLLTYTVDTTKSNYGSNMSLIDYLEFATTEEYEVPRMIDEVDNYTSSPMQDNDSTFSQKIDEIINYNSNKNSGFSVNYNDEYSDKIINVAVNENITNSVMDSTATTNNYFSDKEIGNSYIMKEDRFDIQDISLKPNTEVFSGNSDISLKENRTDMEINTPTTTNSEDLAAVTLNSNSITSSLENSLSVNDNLLTPDVESGHTVQINSNDNGSFNNNSIDFLDTTIISSSSTLSESISPNSSSDIMSTTEQNENPNQEMKSLPNQPQELVDNVLPKTSSTVSPTTVTPISVKPVANKMDTWIILIIVCLLSMIIVAGGIFLFIRLIRSQNGNFQIAPYDVI